MNTPVDNPADWPCHHLCIAEDIDPHMWLVATVNASMWLHQAARGEVPHGGITLPTQEKPVNEPITFDGPEMMPFGDGNE